MLKLLEKLKSENVISELNYQFAKMIDRKQQGFGYTAQQQNLAVLLAALVSFNVMRGHSALPLALAMEQPFDLKTEKGGLNLTDEILQKIGHISPLEWQTLLENHIAFSHSPEKIAPLLFQNGLLYFYRYWQDEHNVCNYLAQAVQFSNNNADLALDKQILTELFGEPNEEIDWQKIAVATALRKQFCVISGGPGTGKTRTVVRLLAALQLKQLKQDKPLLKIGLVAPTGKAAARLKESIVHNLAELPLPQMLKESLTINASTIHRLLGIRPQADKPKYHQRNPLHLDLLIVDEASMIDLSLMEKLMAALKPNAKLIILGDKDQLASVEVGAIMGELGQFIKQGYSAEHSEYLKQITGYSIPAKENVPAICDSLCHLNKSYRFDENSGIGELAKNVNAQQADKSWETLTNKKYSDLTYIEYPSATKFTEKKQWLQACVNLIVEKAVVLYREYLALVKQRQEHPELVKVGDIFAAFQKVRFLSALRVGELGVVKLNQSIAEALRSANLVEFHHARERYCGKPILITENAPHNQIYSGDIGIILPDEEGHLKVYFDTKIENEHLSLSLSRIPDSEPAYVMTVHKSQGSEFEHTIFIVPVSVNPVLTKELIYTAVTRAKKHFSAFSGKKVWQQGVNINIQRYSGLQEQLKNKLS